MQEQPKRKISKFTIALIVVSVLAIAASVVFYLLYVNNQPESAKQQELLQKIGRSIELPSEQPTVVTISDKSRLTNKQLAEKVDNGDMLLVFAQAKRLVIYRPSNEKVMNMLSFETAAEAVTEQTPAKK